jgi:prevent-host-death family protein
MSSVTVSEARAHLPELISRVDGGEEITITKHGRPVAVLVRPDLLRSRRALDVMVDAERVHELLAAARAVPVPVAGGLSAARAEELIGEIRAGRKSR